MKKLKLYFLTAFLALVGLYTYTWYLGANKLEMAIVDQVKILEEKGYRIAYGAIRVKGFPFKINLEIDDALIEAPAPVSASLTINGTLHGYASLMDPTSVMFKADQGIEIKTSLLKENNNTVLKSQSLSAHMPLPMPLKNFEITFQNVHIGAVDIKTETLSLGLKLHESDRALDIYSFDITKIDPGKKLVSGLPQIINQVTGQLSLTGRIRVDIPLDQAVSKWYETNGIADVGLLSIQWGGLKIETNGTFALDESLQPLAAFSAEIYGLDDILEKLKNLGFIHENLLPLLKTSLSFLKESKKNPEGESKEIYHKIAITVQDNDVVIGSIPVIKMPPINWAKVGELNVSTR